MRTYAESGVFLKLLAYNTLHWSSSYGKSFNATRTKGQVENSSERFLKTLKDRNDLNFSWWCACKDVLSFNMLTFTKAEDSTTGAWKELRCAKH